MVDSSKCSSNGADGAVRRLHLTAPCVSAKGGFFRVVSGVCVPHRQELHPVAELGQLPLEDEQASLVPSRVGMILAEALSGVLAVEEGGERGGDGKRRSREGRRVSAHAERASDAGAMCEMSPRQRKSIPSTSLSGG